MSQYPFLFQAAAHDCVPASVLAVRQYYQMQLDLNEIRSALVTNPATGTTIKHMNNLVPT